MLGCVLGHRGLFAILFTVLGAAFPFFQLLLAIMLPGVHCSAMSNSMMWLRWQQLVRGHTEYHDLKKKEFSKLIFSDIPRTCCNGRLLNRSLCHHMFSTSVNIAAAANCALTTVVSAQIYCEAIPQKPPARSLLAHSPI